MSPFAVCAVRPFKLMFEIPKYYRVLIIPFIYEQTENLETGKQYNYLVIFINY